LGKEIKRSRLVEVSMQPKLRGVFFDEGGTLILGHSKAYDYLAEEVNKRYGLEGFREAFDKEFEEAFYEKSKCSRRFYSLREIHVEALRRVLNRFVKQITMEEILSLIDSFYFKLERVLYPHPEAQKVLKKLKKLKFVLGIVSNHDTELLHRELEKAGLLKFLDVIVSSEEAEAYKPFPKPFLLALHKAKLTANQVMYVGDRHEIDIVGAKNAGMIAVLIRRELNSNLGINPAPDYTVTNLREVCGVAVKLR
jgi:2-haloalkanoic acid dehalogenase type II